MNHEPDKPMFITIITTYLSFLFVSPDFYTTLGPLFCFRNSRIVVCIGFSIGCRGTETGWVGRMYRLRHSGLVIRKSNQTWPGI